MAGIHRRNRMAPEMIQIFVIVNILNIISSTLATVESHGQAFIQTDNELRYMGDHIDGVPLHISGSKIQDIGLQDGGTTSGPIRFDPPSLDFRDQPVGMPHMEQVTVHNPDTKTSLHLLSISGSTLHFHCSFFQDKMVPPGGNTTFDVVFLARQVGTVENTLYIHTTQGSFKYQVVGIGVPNPYRIRPFIGAKVPLNSSYSPLIQMHNPHNSILQVVEMYSSGGDLHLELPTGEKEAPKNLWEIPPFETKPVMRASFVGRIENNHTAFIRIKTNRDKKDEVLILPVEVEVTSSPGIFSPLEMLDFGILRTLDEPKTLRLNLLNSGIKPIHISSITVSPPNDAISIEFRPVKLQPDIIQTTPVALISYIASKAVHPSQWNGKIVVKSKSGQFKVMIPYQANVLHGSLVYDHNKTMFYTGQPPYKNVTRHIQMINTFNFTVVVYNVSVPDAGRRYFSVSVENVTGPLMLRPQETVSAMVLQFHPNSTHLHLSTDIHLATNASLFVFPVVVYNGKLKVVHHRPEIFKGQLDFGTMGVGENRTMTFTLRNDNPVDIIIREFGANLEKTKVELLGVEKGNGTTLTQQHNLSEIDTNPLVLKPYHFAVFSVNLVAPSWEGIFAAEVIIVTQFENLYIPLTLKTAEGSLNAVPDKVVFDKCFPSKIPYQELKIHSSFDNHMEVHHVTFQPNDTRFYYEPPVQGKATRLEPHRDNIIGRIYFDAKKECQKDCYVGLPTYIPAGHQWLLGAALDRDVADTDQYLYTRFQQKWQLLGQHQLSTINVTIQLDTNQVRGFLFPAQAHLHWPSLVKRHKIKFPLTQIGNLSIADFIVENPADVPVLMQILTLSQYPSPQTIVDMVSPKLVEDLTDYIEMDDLDVFTLQDLEQYSPNAAGTLAAQRKGIENSLGVKPHKQTVTLMVGGGTKVRVRVGFTPKDDLSRTSLIIVRNNLTIVDTLVVQGQGGRGEMRFSNKKAGSSMPLLFDMTEKHLKSCDKKKQSKNTPPSFTVKRTFTARNTGQLPFYIHGFSISDSSCEGYGFKVLECQGFELQPNSTRKIDIAFTPDFTMSRMRRTLSVHTSLGPAINYTLQASIPSHMLTRCAAALPRPPWEPILYYSALCTMSLLLIVILIASYFEADRIFTADILKRRSKVTSSQSTFDKSRVFDLKNIASVGRPIPTALAPDTKCPNQQKAPIQEIHHGPRDPPQPRRKSIFVRPFIFLKSLFTRRSPNESGNRTRPTTERQNSRDKEVRNGTSPNNVKPSAVSVTADKPPSQTDINTTSNTADSKVSANGKQASNKRSKAAKRQLPDLITSNAELSGINVNDSTNNNKKQGSNSRNSSGDSSTTPNGTGVHRRVSDADHKTLSYPDKDHGRALSEPKNIPEPKLTSANLQSVYKGRASGMNQLDFIDNSDMTSDSIDDIKKEDSKKLRQQKIRKVDARNQRSKKRIRPELPVEHDKDDASSTTTESSSAEADEKTSSARDSTPEPPNTKKKTRSARKEKKRMDAEEDENHDDEFVITSKSKAHKKIKVDPKNAFGGNIMRPSSIELPYTTRLEAAKADRPDIIAGTNANSDRPNKKLSRNRNNKNKNVSAATTTTTTTTSTTNSAGTSDDRAHAGLSVRIARSDSDSSTDRGSSGSPTWDMPPPRNLSGDHSQPDQGDLSDLSLQTAIFAAKHSKPIYSSMSVSGTNDNLSASSRSSSYSSVVSNGSNDAARNKNSNKYSGSGIGETTPPPQTSPQQPSLTQTSQTAPSTTQNIGSAMSNAKKSAAVAGLLPEELKHPGAIGTRTLSPKPNTLPVGPNALQKNNPWTMAGSPITPEGLSGYGLHPIQEAQHPMAPGQGMPQDEAFINTMNDGMGQFPMGQYEQPVTMMQRLRLERRQRLIDYQQRVVQGEDWPGFNLPVQTSFWDSSLANAVPPTADAWSTMNNSPPRHPGGAPMWDNPMSSTANSTWSHDVSSIWSTNNGSPADTMLASDPVSPASSQASPQPTNMGPGSGNDVNTPTSVASFDPFNTLGNIWRPGTSANTGTWGFPTSKPDDVE